ncbi:hypothetical protein [Sedimenticola thiotaurini]|uniref:Uncharacterized protein n=1 Tax=Sedimenticola thiotaurini TaxID=1543721 RepID=A0A0F7JZN3_9GAMM|nr:hypothetical protein [Sedimenticola thiotaurini]AKH21796.1 hypothetical protein AAY24_17250 [Sedimenticola thiotaurini]
MIEVSRLLLMILIELLILSSACAGVITYLFLSKRRRERAAVKSLIAAVRQDSERRDGETRQVLQQRFGLSGGGLDETAGKISRGEKQFYQTVIDLFLHRNTVALQNFSVDYEKSVEPYRTLELSLGTAGAATEPPAEAPDDSADELYLLREENKRLSDELQLTMNTMGTMLNEYTQMFAGGAEAGMDRSKIRQLIAPGADSGAPSGDETAEPPAEEAAAGPDPDPESLGDEAQQVGDESPVEGDEPVVPDQPDGDIEVVAEDGVSTSPDQDEAVQVNADSQDTPAGLHPAQDEEVVNLDDVLEDPDSKDT